MAADKKNTVLFVDDEENVLKSVQRLFNFEEYKIIGVDSAEKALDILGKEEVSVMVTDLKMPNISGIQLIQKVDRLYPDVVKIILSAYYQVMDVILAINSGRIFYFLTKTWKFEQELLDIIRKAVAYYNQNQKIHSLEDTLQRLSADIEKKSSQYEAIIEKCGVNIVTLVSYLHGIISDIKDSEQCRKNELIKLRTMGLESIKSLREDLKDAGLEKIIESISKMKKSKSV